MNKRFALFGVFMLVTGCLAAGVADGGEIRQRVRVVPGSDIFLPEFKPTTANTTLVLEIEAVDGYFTRPSQIVAKGGDYWGPVAGQNKPGQTVHVFKTRNAVDPGVAYFVRIQGHMAQGKPPQPAPPGPPAPAPGPAVPPPDNWAVNVPQAELQVLAPKVKEAAGLMLGIGEPATTIKVVAGPRIRGRQGDQDIPIPGLVMKLDLPADKAVIKVLIGDDNTETIGSIDVGALTSFKVVPVAQGTARITLRYMVSGKIYLSDTLTVNVVGDGLQIVPTLDYLEVGQNKTYYAYRVKEAGKPPEKDTTVTWTSPQTRGGHLTITPVDNGGARIKATVASTVQDDFALTATPKAGAVATETFTATRLTFSPQGRGVRPTIVTAGDTIKYDFSVTVAPDIEDLHIKTVDVILASQSARLFEGNGQFRGKRTYRIVSGDDKQPNLTDIGVPSTVGNNVPLAFRVIVASKAFQFNPVDTPVEVNADAVSFAQVLQAESKTGDGQTAVAHSVINRVNYQFIDGGHAFSQSALHVPTKGTLAERILGTATSGAFADGFPLTETEQSAREVAKAALAGTLGADTTGGAIYFYTTGTPTPLVTDLANVDLLIQTVETGGNTFFKAKPGLDLKQIKDGYDANPNDSLKW